MCNTPAKSPSFHVIIVAGGSGRRFGSDTPKQFQIIDDKSVIYHSVAKFERMSECAQIVVACTDEYTNTCHELLSSLGNVTFTNGGDSRKESVFNGLKALANISDEDIVLIHDAARPCVLENDIRNLLDCMQENRAASLACPVSATLRKQVQGSDQLAGEPISRDGVWEMQTPQAFRYGDIFAAHKSDSGKDEQTDDTQLASLYGIPVKLVAASPMNIKITQPQDLDLARLYIEGLKQSNMNYETRTGQGYDVHAFDNSKAGPVRLCGVDIEHTKALKGHSDADVGLHALTDAIYGALAAGDIGVHFPPSDDSFKDMDSAVFLEHAINMMRERGAELVNADVTLVCEKPKISPHSADMRTRIAQICDVDVSRINVKATTSEQLGFTGRGEGIASMATVNIKIPVEE